MGEHNNNNRDFTDEELIEFYLKLDKLKNNFKKDNKYGFDLKAKQFALRVRHLKPQQYGLRVQSFFAYHLNFTMTPSSWDLGDFKTKGGHDIEFKCSFIDNDTNKINVKQIRNWQDLNYYYVFTIDFTDYRDIKFKCYELSKKEMIYECLVMKAKGVANTKDHHHEKSALGFSITIGTEHYDRWEKNYLNNKFNIEQIVDENLIKIADITDKDNLISRQAEMIKELEKQLLLLKNKTPACYKEEVIKEEEQIIITEDSKAWDHVILVDRQHWLATHQPAARYNTIY